MTEKHHAQYALGFLFVGMAQNYEKKRESMAPLQLL